MSSIEKVIQTPGGNFRVRASYGSDGAHGLRVPDAFKPDAFKNHGNFIIRHKPLDYLYTDEQVRKNYGTVLREIYPVISKLMGANSVKNDEIVHLGELQRENGVFYVEGAFRGETTRFYLFTEEQAKKMDINLAKPAFAVIEDGYNIVDSGKDSYAIHTPESALPNLRLFYGTFESGELRYVEKEFFAPLGEIAESFDAKRTRVLNYVKPGSAARGDGIGGYGGMFDVNFGVGVVYDDYRPGLFGVVTEEVAAKQGAVISAKVTKADDVVAKINVLFASLPTMTDAELKLKVAQVNEPAKNI